MIEIDNAHYLVRYLRTTYVALQYSLLNSPALLFFSQEGGGRARLTIGPIGRIVLSAVRVTRPPNAPAFFIRIVDRVCTIRVSTFPSRNHPVPRAKIQRRAPEATSQRLRGIFRQSPYLGKTRPSDPTPPPNECYLWVSSPRVPFPWYISTSGSRIQEPLPPRHEPVPPSWEYPTPPRVN